MTVATREPAPPLRRLGIVNAPRRLDRRRLPGPRDALVGLSCLAALLNVPASVVSGMPWNGVIVTTGVGIAASLWVLRRRSPTPPVWHAPAFAAAVGLSFLAGDGVMHVPLALVAMLLLVLDRGIRAGLVFAGLVVLGIIGVMVWGYDVSVPFALMQAAVLALLFAFGLAYAGLVHRLQRSRDERVRAAAELDALNTALQSANDELRRSAALERDLVLAQERARAARELHDGLGHRLTIVAMSLDYAERMRERDPRRAWQEVSTARTLTGEAMTQMRQWVRALHPAQIGHLNDAEAFDAIADSFRGTGLDVRVEQAGTPRALPQPVSLLCHRLVQEGLTNVLRHADATRVLITLRFLPHRLRITLRDNGVGAQSVVEGFGLRSVRERVSALGGTMEIVTAPGEGMSLTVEVPAEPLAVPVDTPSPCPPDPLGPSSLDSLVPQDSR